MSSLISRSTHAHVPESVYGDTSARTDHFRATRYKTARSSGIRHVEPSNLDGFARQAAWRAERNLQRESCGSSEGYVVKNRM